MVLATDERVLGAARSLPSDRFEVFSTNDPRVALREAGRGELALVDLDLNGFSVVRELKDRERDVAVVMFCPRLQDVWLCRQAGADEVLLRPLRDTSELLRAVESILQAARA